MVLLELFFALLLIAIILFGKIEISATSFKVVLKIGGWTQPLISVAYNKKNSGDNVSI